MTQVAFRFKLSCQQSIKTQNVLLPLTNDILWQMTLFKVITKRSFMYSDIG